MHLKIYYKLDKTNKTQTQTPFFFSINREKFKKQHPKNEALIMYNYMNDF